MNVATLLRRHGISRPTYYLWRSKYAGPPPSVATLKAAIRRRLKTGHRVGAETCADSD